MHATSARLQPMVDFIAAVINWWHGKILEKARGQRTLKKTFDIAQSNHITSDKDCGGRAPRKSVSEPTNTKNLFFDAAAVKPVINRAREEDNVSHLFWKVFLLSRLATVNLTSLSATDDWKAITHSSNFYVCTRDETERDMTGQSVHHNKLAGGYTWCSIMTYDHFNSLLRAHLSLTIESWTKPQ